QRGDHRLLDSLEAIERRLRLRDKAPKAAQVRTPRARVTRNAALTAERAEVDSRREHRAFAVENDRAHAGLIGAGQRLGDSTQHRVADRIAFVRPIERHVGDLALDSYLD